MHRKQNVLKRKIVATFTAIAVALGLAVATAGAASARSTQKYSGSNNKVNSYNCISEKSAGDFLYDTWIC